MTNINRLASITTINGEKTIIPTIHIIAIITTITPAATIAMV